MKKKFAWGITGSGDEIKEIMGAMTKYNEDNPDVETRVFLSKSAE